MNTLKPDRRSSMIAFRAPSVVLELIDSEAQRLGMSRSEYTRQALFDALREQGVWPPRRPEADQPRATTRGAK